MRKRFRAGVYSEVITFKRMFVPLTVLYTVRLLGV